MVRIVILIALAGLLIAHAILHGRQTETKVYVWAYDSQSAISSIYSRKDFSSLKDALKSPERKLSGFRLFEITASPK